MAYVPDDFGNRSTACSAHSAQLSRVQASFLSASPVCIEHTFLLLCLQSGLPWKEDLEFELCQILSGQICPLPGVTVLCTGAKCSSPAFIGNKAAGWSSNACCGWPPLCTPGWPGPCLKYIYSGDRQLGCQASLCYLPTWDSGKVIYFLVSLSAFVK